jgi:hypothetical protein
MWYLLSMLIFKSHTTFCIAYISIFTNVTVCQAVGLIFHNVHIIRPGLFLELG